MRRLLPAIAFLLAFVSWAYSEGMPREPAYRIPLPGVTGRIDHMAVDTAGNRLYIAALGNNSLEIVDLRENRRVRSLPGLREPQGVVFMANPDRIVVANGGDGTCLVLDATTLELFKRIDVGEDADNLRYDAVAKQVFVGYGNGAIGIFNDKFQRIGVVPLPGHPESFALSRADGRMFVNVPAINAVVVVDVKKRQIVDTWKLRNARGNFPMSLDERNHLLFVGTRDPSRLIGFDTQSGREVEDIPIDDDPDDIFIDSQRNSIYVSCGEGYLDVVERTGSGHYQSLERIPTAAGARTCLFAPELCRLFLAVPHRGQQEPAVWIYIARPDVGTNGHAT